MWLSGLSAGLQPKGSPVRFPSGHMPGLQAKVPSEGGHARGNCTLVFLSLSFSLPSCLRDKNNLLKKKKKETCLLFFLPIKPTIIKFMGLLMESEKQGNDSMCVFPSGLSIHASRGQNVTAYCFSHSIIFPPKRWSVYI